MPESVVYQRECAVCGAAFETIYTRKHICSFGCRQEAMRVSGRAGSKQRKQRRKDARVLRCCVVCGWNETVDLHHDVGATYILCPNHHALITRNITTIQEMLSIDKAVDNSVPIDSSTDKPLE